MPAVYQHSLIVCLALFPTGLAAQPLQFHLRFAPSVSKKIFTGRVYVMLSKRNSSRLPSGPRWTNTEPFFAKDVIGWQPGQDVAISSSDLGFPYNLDKLPKGTYYARALMDFNRGARSFVRGEGNGYSEAVKLVLDPQKTGIVKLTLDRVFSAASIQRDRTSEAR